jgi:3-oxoacyl-[acyl-carrier-protein] synthase-1
MTEYFLSNFGAATPIGFGEKTVTTMALAGVARLMRHPYFLDKDHEPVPVSYVDYLDDTIPAVERMAILTSAALIQTLDPIVSPPWDIPVILAIPPSRPGLPCQGMPYAYQERFLKWTRAILSEKCGEKAREKFGEKAQILAIETVEEEQAASILALVKGMEKLDSGQTDLVIVGGADSWFEYETLEWLENERLLQTSANPHGFIPGEGAGTFALTRAAGLQKYGLVPVCTVAGTGTAVEKDPSFTKGQALAEAVTKAVSGASPPERISVIYSDMNGERFRTDDLGYSASRLSPLLAEGAEPRTLSDLIGDTGAATGMLLIGQAAFDARTENEPRALVWTASKSGLRGAVLIMPVCD